MAIDWWTMETSSLIKISLNEIASLGYGVLYIDELINAASRKRFVFFSIARYIVIWTFKAWMPRLGKNTIVSFK